MKRAEVRRFVEGFLRQRGAQLDNSGPDLLDISYAGDGAGRTQVAFGSRAHRLYPEAELVAIGSSYLDRMVSESTRSGRYVVAYRPVPPDRAPEPQCHNLPTVSGASWAKPRRAYRPQFLFVYVAEYRTIDVPDDLIMIGFDPARGEEFSAAGPFLERLADGLPEIGDGWMELRAWPSPGTLWRSLDALDRRLKRRAGKVKESAALEIARETANIEAYYRQLIDEVRYPVGRGRLTPQSESERVRTLQLDWKRRVHEVARFWGADANVRLSALGVVMEPCWAMALRGRGPRGGKHGRGPVCLVTDYTSGALIKPRCPICGARLAAEADLAGADLICAAHVNRQADGEPAED